MLEWEYYIYYSIWSLLSRCFPCNNIAPFRHAVEILHSHLPSVGSDMGEKLRKKPALPARVFRIVVVKNAAPGIHRVAFSVVHAGALFQKHDLVRPDLTARFQPHEVDP